MGEEVDDEGFGPPKIFGVALLMSEETEMFRGEAKACLSNKYWQDLAQSINQSIDHGFIEICQNAYYDKVRTSKSRLPI